LKSLRTYSVFCLLGWLILSALIAKRANAQLDSSDLNQKYWLYRERFKKDFIRVGEGRGKSIAMAGRAYNEQGKVIIYYGDNVTYHGWYLAALATEFAILKRDSLPTASLLKELYYAIEALNRLDSYAEIMYVDSTGKRGSPNLNGFFVRDDIDKNFRTEFPGTDVVLSDYLLGESFGVGNAKYQADNEMSQDQAIHALFGLTLITHYVDDEAETKGIKLQAYARETALRIIRYIAQKNWIIYNPVTGKKVYRGPDARLFSYGFRKTAKKINGGKIPIDLPKAKWYSAPALGLMSTGLTPVFFNRTMVLILATTGNTWGPPRITNRFLGIQDIMWHKEIFPLAHAELYGIKHTLSPKLREPRIRRMLESADPNNHGAFGPWGWNTSNRWLASHKKFNTYDGFFKKRDNPGLDYMTLHNLYRLRFRK
jgi:hypothetical protein